MALCRSGLPLVLLGLLSACGAPVPPAEETGELVVGTRNYPATYFIAPNGEAAGYEHDVLRAFAQSQQWSVKWLEKNDPGALFDALDKRTIHLAAAALPQAVVRDRHFIAGPVLFDTPVHVIVRADRSAPRSMRELAGKRLALIAGSGHTPMLQRLKRKHPGLVWQTLENVWPEELLAKLQDGDYDAVLVNGMVYDPMRNLYPELGVAFDLPDKQKIVWALHPLTPQDLRNRLARFIDSARKDGTLARIYERYFGHVQQLDRSDVVGILERRLQRLPPLRRHFQEAQTITGIDWRLLAAIGYQESQWNAYATSPTGVRGLMMLTGETADRMGVTNRLDARQSILGGARYLAQLKDALPARIPEPDRTWLALAAYNVGQGHMEDARRIAQARGGDPDSWLDVKAALPYLSRGTYSRVMKYGYARGYEALGLAENIRNYHEILLRMEPEYNPLINLGRRESQIASPG